MAANEHQSELQAQSVPPIEAPELPFPILRLSSARPRYLLYDIQTVSWLRQEHNILGVAIGGMPQFPQQNVFFGLPLELMPEESKLLVDKDVAFIVNDLDTHAAQMERLKTGNHATLQALARFRANIRDVADQFERDSRDLKNREMERVRLEKGLPPPRIKPVSNRFSSEFIAARLPLFGPPENDKTPPSGSVFGEMTVPHKDAGKAGSPEDSSWSVTPTTSSALLSRSSMSCSSQAVNVPAARFAVFKELHDRGYFMTPGLRFGCQFTAYPGDPLRYHSHFLASGLGWDEEFDLLDLVGGGRLGTGVKKGYLIGGRQPSEGDGAVRAFCIEWAGM